MHAQFWLFTFVPLLVTVLFTLFTGVIPGHGSAQPCSAVWYVLFVILGLILSALGVLVVWWMR
jgi:hypothetical protein